MSGAGVDEFREQLIELGYARWERALVRPTVADVSKDSDRARLVAAGVDLDRLVPPTMPGRATIELVEVGE